MKSKNSKGNMKCQLNFYKLLTKLTKNKEEKGDKNKNFKIKK